MRPPRPIDEEQRAVLQGLLKTTKAKADFRRVLCVWLRASLWLSALQVATAVGWSAGTVRKVQAEFLREGEAALLGVGRGGRRHENLSVAEERRLLSRFVKRAEAGGVLVVAEVKADYEMAVGRSVPKSTVYRMLARHGWRKLAPRPRHPQSDPERQEAFKKNSPR